MPLQHPHPDSGKPPAITADMTVLEIIAAWPETEGAFKRHDAAAGECICCNALFDRLKDISERYHIDLEALMSELEAVRASHAKGENP